MKNESISMSKVLIIGDVIIDKYIYGTSERLSPEAPVPIVKYQNIQESIGGAGLVYENLKNLDISCDILDLSNPKCIKTRVICDGHYVTRIDEDYKTLNALDTIKKKDFSEYEYVILSDYNKGVLDNAKEIIKHINLFDCKIIVDPKQHASQYEGAWLAKPNKKEYIELGFTNWKGNIITTSAGNVIEAFIDNQSFTLSPNQVEVNDVTGAGDCFLAAFVYALILGEDFNTSLKIAVNAATESVKHLGTYILTKNDVEENVVFTNGCFDILHVGHLKLLKHAREQGKKLIVGINSDASVRRLKGNSRPINDQNKRKEALEQLRIIDEVIVFNEDTPYELIKKIKPSLIVKGGDYNIEDVIGHDLAAVELFPIVDDISTTRIIEAIKS